MQRIMAVLALALATLAGSAFAVEPSTLSSLQPFQKFKKGEGEGIAVEYAQRDKRQFVKWLQSGKKRVACDVLVRQMAEAHNLEFEGCVGAIMAIERDENFAVVACTDVMFSRDNWLVVTNPKGTSFGVWHRKCLPNERVLVYKGRPIISSTCGNVAIPVSAPSTVVAAPKPQPAIAVTRECSKGFALVGNAWSYQTLPESFREMTRELVAVAESRDTYGGQNLDGYKGDAFSRTLGGPLRKEVGIRAPLLGAEIPVRFVDKDTRTGWLLVEPVGTMRVVNGVGVFKFSEDPRGRIIETAWPTHFLSPVISGGERLLRLFPEEWGKHCTMNIHGLVP